MKKVKWGVIGAGGIADKKTIPGLLQAENCELIALMDPENIETIARKYHVSQYSENIEDILANSEIEAVYIASPVLYHKEQVIRCACAGKHILCEKPLAMNADDAGEMVSVCQQNNVLLQEGYMMRFHGAHRKMKKMIDDGMIGAPVFARAQLSCWYPPIKRAWRQIPEQGGGGALIDMASHLFDLLEMFLGRVVRVTAFTGSQIFDYPVEDSSVILLHFESGANATVDCFFCIPDNASKTRLEIYGSKGCVLSEGTIGQGSGGFLEYYTESEEKGYDAVQDKNAESGFIPLAFNKLNLYEEECRYFSNCILAGREPEINTGSNGVHILKIVEAAYRSSISGITQNIMD